MAQKKTPWLLYGLLLGGGYVAYRLYENYATGTAAPAAAAAPPAGTALTVVPVSTSANGGAVDQVAAPVTISTASTVPAGITSQMYSVVQSWAQTDGRAPVLRFASANVPAEYAGMYDIITNCWDKNVKPNTTQTAFWNALRSKYDPGDAIW